MQSLNTLRASQVETRVLESTNWNAGLLKKHLGERKEVVRERSGGCNDWVERWTSWRLFAKSSAWGIHSQEGFWTTTPADKSMDWFVAWPSDFCGYCIMSSPRRALPETGLAGGKWADVRIDRAKANTSVSSLSKSMWWADECLWSVSR